MFEVRNKENDLVKRKGDAEFVSVSNESRSDVVYSNGVNT
jgi:hypothetical protein